MGTYGKITVELLTELAKLIALLTAEGITFEVRKDEFTKVWIIETKGY